MDRCPNCGARNPGDRQCRRCGMDLSLLLAVEVAAHQQVHEALERLATGDDAAGQVLLNQASALHHDPMIDLIRGFAERFADQDSSNHPATNAPASPDSRPVYPY